MPSQVSSGSYALWLIPGGEPQRRLTHTIRRLSREFGTPAFAPHVTLVSSIRGSKREVLSKAAQLAKQIPRLTMRLTRIEGQREYFRCIIARAALDEGLRRAHGLAKKAFDLRPKRRFLPHLSLVYGGLSPGTKRSIIASFGKDWAMEFSVRRMDVVRIQGAPRRWRRVGTLCLTARQARRTVHSDLRL